MAIREDKKTVALNIKVEIAEEIERRAKSMQLSTGKYCEIILQQWMDSGKKLKLQEK